MVIEIPSDISSRIADNEQQVRLELAIYFYKEFKISSGKAAAFAGISRIEFWEELGNRDIEFNMEFDSISNDVYTLESLGI